MEKKKPLRVISVTRQRIDVYIKDNTELSRAQVQNLITENNVFLNGKVVTSPNSKVGNDDLIEYVRELPREYKLEAEDIPLDILYKDENIIVINKQAGLVVHPAPGNYTGTLVNALIGKHIDEASYLGGGARLGIVHRLDKDTSGVMVVARNNEAHEKLVNLFKEKEVKKTYNCLVHGVVGKEGYINTYISRDTKDRKKFSAKAMHGKEAQTLFEPEQIFATTTLLKIRILTGRTHQIRVHMNFIKNEVIGDETYGNKGKDVQLLEYMGYDKKSYKDVLPRQLLHARFLEFTHPFTGERVCYEAPLPDDMNRVIAVLSKKCE